jgi:hypothetical protein
LEGVDLSDSLVFQIETHVRLHYIDIRDDIEGIVINLNEKSIKIIVTKNMGKFIGSKGDNINSLISKLNKQHGGVWKISFPEKLLGRIYSKNKSGQLRPTIIKDDLPLSSPFSALKNEKMVHHLSSHVDEGNTVLITMFRDTVEASKNKKLKDIKGQMGQNKLNFMQRLEQIFPNKTITLLEWPDIYRSSQDIVGSSHPLISYLCRAAAVISKGIVSSENLVKCQGSLTAAAYSELLTRATNKWTILGDETGSLDEFSGNDPDSVSSKMCWIAIPPNTNLNPLDPDYHCSGPDGFKDYTQGINSLYNFDSIMLFTFEFEEGRKTKSASKIVSDPHLSFWMDSLPLVLEKISQTCSEPIEVDIFIEQVGPLQSGIRVIEPLVAELRGGLDNRKGWNHISFSELWVISKGEHPWIGYADLLGAIANNNKCVEKETAKRKELIRSRIHKSPFRQSSLKGVVIQALRETARPLFFLQSLHSIKANDLKDYIRPFFGNAIKESVDSLEPEEWQELLKHIENNSGDKKGQRATALIHEHLNINQVLSKLTSPSDKFDLLRMMLGTSNHRGAIQQGLQCKEKADLLLKGFEPSERKLQKYHNICHGLKDNMFDFEEVDRVGDFEYNSNMEEGHLRQLGTRAHSLGLIGTVKARQIALLIETKLAKHGNEDADYSSHRRRHSIYLSELLMDEEKYIEAEEILDEISHKNRDSFFFASHIKCLTLNEKNNVFFKSKDLDFLELLDDDHPSQRIAYWFARWAIQVGEEKEAPAQKCIEHLLSLTEVPLFSHDAPGVILSCELMDLESRGYEIKIDTMKFYELVKKNSQPSTTEWLKKHPPNEDDWLAPLNFNYR